VSELQQWNFAQAFDAALLREMGDDSSVIVMCTEVVQSALRKFGPQRSRAVPIAENGVSGLAVGAAMAGLRPVVMLRNATFSYLAFDQLLNQAAKMRYMSGGQARVSAVFCVSYYGPAQGMAAQHCQPSYSMYSHVPGIKVVAPSGAADAYGLLRAAIQSDDPVIFVESSALSTHVAEVDPDSVTEIGAAAVARTGSDITIAAASHSVSVALDAARRLASEGVSAEVIDLRTIAPLDRDTIRASVRKTGRLVVVDESPPVCSIAAEIVADVTTDPATFRSLRSAPARVCAAPVPVPFSPPLEAAVWPSASDVVLAVHGLLQADPAPGVVVAR
jgi:pyruvate dehydrogenase E1 component beta subunit